MIAFATTFNAVINGTTKAEINLQIERIYEDEYDYEVNVYGDDLSDDLMDAIYDFFINCVQEWGSYVPESTVQLTFENDEITKA